MTSFYAEKLALNEQDHSHHDSIRKFVDFGVKLHLEKVESADDHVVHGDLALFSENPPAEAETLQQRDVKLRSLTLGEFTGLIIEDPDNNVLTITEDPKGFL